MIIGRSLVMKNAKFHVQWQVRNISQLISSSSDETSLKRRLRLSDLISIRILTFSGRAHPSTHPDREKYENAWHVNIFSPIFFPNNTDPTRPDLLLAVDFFGDYEDPIHTYDYPNGYSVVFMWLMKFVPEFWEEVPVGYSKLNTKLDFVYLSTSFELIKAYEDGIFNKDDDIKRKLEPIVKDRKYSTKLIEDSFVHNTCVPGSSIPRSLPRYFDSNLICGDYLDLAVGGYTFVNDGRKEAILWAFSPYDKIKWIYDADWVQTDHGIQTILERAVFRYIKNNVDEIVEHVDKYYQSIWQSPKNPEKGEKNTQTLRIRK